MNILEIFILAIALSLDALIVSFSYGLILTSERFKNALLLSGAFGFFQFIMPLIGWNFTSIIYKYLKIYSKWIVFCIFIILAIKFLKEAFSKNEKQNIECVGIACIIGLAVATSIDAFGAGITIRFIGGSVIKPSLIIGLTTFLLSITGFYCAGIFNKISLKTVGILSSGLLIYLAFKAIL